MRGRDNRRVKKRDSRTILAENLRRMVDLQAGGSVRAWALARELDVKLIERLTKASHAVTLDKLEEVAAAVGCEPWHLLTPDFNPNDPPAEPISAEDRAMLIRLRRMLGGH